MAAIGCVVFDLDDTLYLERDYVRSGFAAVGRWAKERLGVDDLSAQAWALFEDGCRGSIFDDVLRYQGIVPTSDIVEQLVEIYRSHSPSIAPLRDTVECVAELVGRTALAVVTDGPIASQRAKADALGVHKWSRLTVLTEELGEGYGKPHPRSFQMVQRSTGAGGGRCVYVADNPAKDFQGPRSLGWRTVRVRRVGSLHEAVGSGPDVDEELTDLSALTSWLLG